MYSLDALTGQTTRPIFRRYGIGSKYAKSRKEVPFVGLDDT